MAQQTKIDELDYAIKVAAETADPIATSMEIAREFCESNRELIEPYLFEWGVWRIAARMGKYRAKKSRANDRQAVFEEIIGIKPQLLPRQVEVAGETVSRSEAKIETFRKLAQQLKKKRTPEYEAALQVVAMMEPYTKKNKNITYGEVLKLEAVKKAKKDKLTLPLFPEDEKQ